MGKEKKNQQEFPTECLNYNKDYNMQNELGRSYILFIVTQYFV